jgi:GrpB-like predicted nucleotidyltransferase (UPF0157 family)
MNVRLSEFSEQWAKMYEQEVERLNEIFKDDVIRFEHFGSTSVEGMKAKPVVDMMCIVKDINIIDGYNEKMASLGYDVAGDWGIPGRRLFRKGGEERTHHIHVYQFDHPQIDRHLVFRDYLRSHQEEVIRYSNFKEELAAIYERTNEYSPAKKAFVSEMEKLALDWFKGKKDFN